MFHDGLCHPFEKQALFSYQLWQSWYDSDLDSTTIAAAATIANNTTTTITIKKDWKQKQGFKAG